MKPIPETKLESANLKSSKSALILLPEWAWIPPFLVLVVRSSGSPVPAWMRGLDYLDRSPNDQHKLAVVFFRRDVIKFLRKPRRIRGTVPNFAGAHACLEVPIHQELCSTGSAPQLGLVWECASGTPSRVLARGLRNLRCPSYRRAPWPTPRAGCHVPWRPGPRPDRCRRW